MPQFRRKLTLVDAEQFWPDQPLPFRTRGPYVVFGDRGFYVTTAHSFEGYQQRVYLEPGDWVIPEPVGPHVVAFAAYPVKPDIFQQTYEPVDAAPDGPAYVYKARVQRVIDGDTYELLIDMGFDAWHVVPVRLRGIDCPERNTPEGQAARAFAEQVLAARANGEILVRTQKTKTGADVRSFARYVADIWVAGQHLADVLREAGHVKTDAAPTSPRP